MEAGFHRRSGPEAPDSRRSPPAARAVLLLEIKAAKKRFGLSGGCSGCLLLRGGTRRFLAASLSAGPGVQNQVVDSSSIEVNRRQRRAKSDGLDAVKLVEMLIRWHNGERKVWSTGPCAYREQTRISGSCTGR